MSCCSAIGQLVDGDIQVVEVVQACELEWPCAAEVLRVDVGSAPQQQLCDACRKRTTSFQMPFLCSAASQVSRITRRWFPYVFGRVRRQSAEACVLAGDTSGG